MEGTFDLCSEDWMCDRNRKWVTSLDVCKRIDADGDGGLLSICIVFVNQSSILGGVQETDSNRLEKILWPRE